MADKTKPEDRNEGKADPSADQKNPNPNDIHSDDPLVAGLANGERQGEGEDTPAAKPVDS